ncbi:MAG: GNAT family N-acetyltransferase [Lachnotalea sp.]
MLVKDNQVVSTITVNHMKYLFGQEKTYIQLGGVLTREEHYKRGLSRWLMNEIVDQYKSKCDQIFLLSDDVAVDFYPKMGFEKAIEYIGCYEWKKEDCICIYGRNQLLTVRKLNIGFGNDRKILLDCYKQSNPFSIFPSVDCEELVIFYGLEFKKDCFYYFPELELVAIVSIKENIVYIDDIYGKLDINIGNDGIDLLNILIKKVLEQNNREEDSMSIQFGFSPKEELAGINIKPFIQKDDTYQIDYHFHTRKVMLSGGLIWLKQRTVKRGFIELSLSMENA